MISRPNIPSPARFIGTACVSVMLLGAVLLTAKIAVTKLPLEGIFNRRSYVADRLTVFVVFSLIVVLGYMLYRLWPVARTLGKLRQGIAVDDLDRKKAAFNAIVLPVGLSLGSIMVVIGVSLVLWLSGLLQVRWPINIPARQLLTLQALILLFGGFSYLILRRLLRPVLTVLSVSVVPLRQRFGLRVRMVIWGLLVAIVVITPLLVVDAVMMGELIVQADQKVGLEQSGVSSLGNVLPLLSGPKLLALLLALVFAGSTGWMLGQELRTPAVTVRRMLDRMRTKEVSATIERLPVHSTTEVGMIAVAFNRLADRVEGEYQKLAEYAQKVKQTESVRSGFLANVSHELRTPLNSIIGFSDLLIRGYEGELNQSQKRDVQVIGGEGERLLRLINDILLMASFEAGKSFLMPEKLKMSELLVKIVDSLQPDVAGAFEGPEDDDLVHCILNVDGSKFVRAVVAMVEYVYEKKSDEKVVLRMQLLADNTLRVGVVRKDFDWPDNNLKEKLFEGFRYSDNESGVDSRTSLGLPLARKIANLHGGDVTFVREEGAAGLEMAFKSTIEQIG
ncbi:MAG: HAMP domain-containing histidine kinase [Deltaproteobacteria bacterium]|nr:HAMP domain-containing histidine kinase [Deltaproteobacteria bacterium]